MKVMKTNLELGSCCTYNNQICCLCRLGKRCSIGRTREQLFFLLCLSARHFLCLIMGPSSVLELSEDVLMLLLHNMDQLDLCVYDKHLQRVKREQYEGKVNK